jgi:hypothetical protein
VKQHVEESAYCEFLFSELVAFNDPDEDEYEEDDSYSSRYYLGEEFSQSYWIFSGVANGDVATFLKLYFETSRLEVVKTFAFSRTFHKLNKKR